jgi:hypothetical protein
LVGCLPEKLTGFLSPVELYECHGNRAMCGGDLTLLLGILRIGRCKAFQDRERLLLRG